MEVDFLAAWKIFRKSRTCEHVGDVEDEDFENSCTSSLKFAKMSIRKFQGISTEKSLSAQEQQAKISDVRKILGPVANKLPVLCSDASISRYLRARNWNTKKASKMLKATLKWRWEFKPEKIQWEDVAREAETGKIYRANYFDKEGRTILILRPGFQNTSDIKGQIRHLVYCVENAIMTLNPDQEQMVWLIDFEGWKMSCISVKAARETAHILQNHYPERLGVGILYNPPKVFESFWKLVKPFIEPKTYKKVRFVYPNDPQSQKMMEELFDMDKLNCAFGGRNSAGFNYETYAQWMREDDKKKFDMINSGSSSPLPSIMSEPQNSETLTPNCISMVSDEDECSSGDEKTLNLENTEEETQDLPLSCKDVAGGEAVDVAKELKKGELA
ncbi:unnamed protein product [Dovyalis caffra]|uniref:CRAL-TRIO domain-containing protein n=1 Tax=Dovyalis caffra TaxID=77055 RepID=A0AAV1RY95_9ROSI|nr:unnamed protein product [Dovyalis caffra]